MCGFRVLRFDPLSDEFLKLPRQLGFKFTTAEAETCNAEGYYCPHCGSSDRERLYALYLRDYIQTTRANGLVQILDFAPAPSFSIFIRQLIASRPDDFSYRTADLFRDDVDDKIDIMNMPAYRDNSIDFFICSHVLEHVPDDRKALSELYRVVKAGGRGILVVPIVLSIIEIDEDPSVTDPAERWRRFGQDDHVRLYSKPGFLARVQAAGFQVYQLDAAHFGADTFRRHGITNQSVLYIVEKA